MIKTIDCTYVFVNPIISLINRFEYQNSLKKTTRKRKYSIVCHNQVQKGDKFK